MVDCNVNTFTFHKIEISLLLSTRPLLSNMMNRRRVGYIGYFQKYKNIMFHLFSATAVRTQVGEIGEAESQSLLEKFSRKT